MCSDYSRRRRRRLQPPASASRGNRKRAAANDVTLDVLIERNADSLGGRERLDQLKSVRVQRTKNVITPSQRPEFHIVYICNGDGSRLYAEGFSGETAWEKYESPVRYPVEGRPKAAL
jgi:hypothetical protein